MTRAWFWSDPHFGHANIIHYSKRPYDSIQEMDEALIHNYNSVVGSGDLVYCLGDFALCDGERAVKIAKRLNGQKYLVFGNHDKRLRKDRTFLEQWIWSKELAEIKVGDQKIVLCHYALLTWNGSHRGSWSLHGHSHGSLREDPHALRTDVGVDCWSYTPVSFEALQKHMSRKDYRPIDHHERKGEEGEETNEP